MSKPNQVPQKGPKTMSSRLSNMKFMQRAAATPLPQSPKTPASDNDRSGKRAKVSHEQETPQRNSSNPHSQSEDSTRPLGVSGAETKWSLGWHGGDVSPTSENEEDDLAPWSHGASNSGRLQFGGFKKRSEKATMPVEDDLDEGEIPSRNSNKGSDMSSGDEAGQFVKQNLAQFREVRAQKAKSERDRPRKVVGERKKKDGKPGARHGISSNAT